MANQQYRVDVLNTAASVESMSVLGTVFATAPGDPSSIGYSPVVFDLTPFAGHPVRLRFADVNNQFYFLTQADEVKVTSFTPSCTIGPFSSPGKITGTAGDDIICGSSGNDDISGGGGNDIVLAGGGADKISGGPGNDTLYGEAGNDSMTGDAGDDVMFGGAGSDLLNGGAGRDGGAGEAGADSCPNTESPHC